MAFIAILGALLVHIGISLYAGAQVFEGFFGIDVVWSILIISVTTTIYTALGGLRAVVVTETIQTVILLGGAVVITLFALFALPDHGIHSFADFKAACKQDHAQHDPPPPECRGTPQRALLAVRAAGLSHLRASGTGARTRPSSSGCSGPAPSGTPASAPSSRASSRSCPSSSWYSPACSPTCSSRTTSGTTRTRPCPCSSRSSSLPGCGASSPRDCWPPS